MYINNHLPHFYPGKPYPPVLPSCGDRLGELFAALFAGLPSRGITGLKRLRLKATSGGQSRTKPTSE